MSKVVKVSRSTLSIVDKLKGPSNQTLNPISLRINHVFSGISTQGFTKSSYKHLTEKLYVICNLETSVILIYVGVSKFLFYFVKLIISMGSQRSWDVCMNVISYIQLVIKENGEQIQKGMNFAILKTYSVVLIST